MAIVEWFCIITTAEQSAIVLHRFYFEVAQENLTLPLSRNANFCNMRGSFLDTVVTLE